MVLRAAGPVFSSGHNLKELTRETSYEEHKAVFAQCESLMLLVGKVGLNTLYNVCWGRERTKSAAKILCRKKTERREIAA